MPAGAVAAKLAVRHDDDDAAAQRERATLA